MLTMILVFLAGVYVGVGSHYFYSVAKNATKGWCHRQATDRSHHNSFVAAWDMGGHARILLRRPLT